MLRPLYEERGVGGVVDYVDVLVAELAHDAVDTAALDAHACAHGIDALVVALYGNLGALTGDARHGADVD